MGSTQDLGAYAGRDLGLRGGQACSNGCLSQCQGRLKLKGGEGDYNGSPAPCSPLNNDVLLLWCPGLFLQTFPVVELFMLSLQSVFSHPTTFPSLGLHSKPRFLAPSHPLQQETHNTGWGAQGCGTDHTCSSYFVLPSIDCLLHSPLIP